MKRLEKKMRYERPEVFAIDSILAQGAFCDDGSSADGCDTGNNAPDGCQFGNLTDLGCVGGTQAVVTCSGGDVYGD